MMPSSGQIIDGAAMLLWFAWCAALGACFVSLFWPRRLMPHRPWLLLGAMSVTAGLAFSSIGHLLWIAAGWPTGIDSWLDVLRRDKRAVFVAATQAQKATDFLLTQLNPSKAEEMPMAA